MLSEKPRAIFSFPILLATLVAFWVYLRIYEMAISYAGRTYEEGKKITWKDGVRALYCIFRYNSYHLPLPVQFLIYTLIGGAAAVMNLVSFLVLLALGA